MAKVLIEENTIDNAIDDFDSIRQAIINKDVQVPIDTPTNQYPNKIASIPSGGELSVIIPKTIEKNGVYNASTDGADGYNPVTVNVPSSGDEWVRPSDRPVVPTLLNNQIYLLYKVLPVGINDMSIACTIGGTTGGHNLRVDWGDGTIVATPTVIAGTLPLDHVYDFSTLNKPINPDGSKWVWIKIYVTTTATGTIPSSNNISGLIRSSRPANRPAPTANNVYIPNVYELYWLSYADNSILDIPNTTTTNYAQYRLCEIVYLRTPTNTPIGIRNNWLADFHNLRILDTSPLLFNSTNNNNYFLQNCYRFNGAINFGAVSSNPNNFMANCYSYNQEFNFPTFKPNSFSSSFAGLTSYDKIITLDTSVLAVVTLNTIPKLKGLRINNMGTVTTTINIANTNIDSDNFMLLLEDLYDRTGLTAGTIPITNTPCANQLSASQVAQFNAKNWNITNWNGY